MSTCTRCAINEAWLAVRNARTYETVVDRAVEWLELFWPEARMMKLAPKSLRDVPCPLMYISPLCGLWTAGKWTGKSIQLSEEAHYSARNREMRMVHRGEQEHARNELRDTILHEVQHAIDELAAGITSTGNNDQFADHPPAFHRRLDKLKRAFPPDGA